MEGRSQERHIAIYKTKRISWARIKEEKRKKMSFTERRKTKKKIFRNEMKQYRKGEKGPIIRFKMSLYQAKIWTLVELFYLNLFSDTFREERE